MSVDLFSLTIRGLVLLDGHILVGSTESLAHCEEAGIRYELGVWVELKTESWLVGEINDTVNGQRLIREEISEGRVNRLSIGRVGLQVNMILKRPATLTMYSQNSELGNDMIAWKLYGPDP